MRKVLVDASGAQSAATREASHDLRRWRTSAPATSILAIRTPMATQSKTCIAVVGETECETTSAHTGYRIGKTLDVMAVTEVRAAGDRF
jgi:hypothetical protein